MCVLLAQLLTACCSLGCRARSKRDPEKEIAALAARRVFVGVLASKGKCFAFDDSGRLRSILRVPHPTSLTTCTSCDSHYAPCYMTRARAPHMRICNEMPLTNSWLTGRGSRTITNRHQAPSTSPPQATSWMPILLPPTLPSCSLPLFLWWFWSS